MRGAWIPFVVAVACVMACVEAEDEPVLVEDEEVWDEADAADAPDATI